MGRTKKSETTKVEEPVVEVEAEEATVNSESQPKTENTKVEDIEEAAVPPTKGDETDEISPRDAELMRLYPQYEEIWITPDGFVHPKGASPFLLKGAKLFKNKFYNK